MVFVSLEYKFIYVHIPRTAGTYMMDVFKGVYPQIKYYDTIKDHTGKSIDLAHLYYPIIERYIPPYILNTYTKITTVRNPYDRVYSAYNLYTTGCRGTYASEHPAAKEYKFKDFKEFVHKYIPPLYQLKAKDITSTNLHLIPQYHFLLDNKEKMIIDKIVKYENLEQLNDFFKKIKLNKTVKKKPIKHYFDKYDKEMIKIVNKVYHLDFTMLAYDKLDV